MCKYSIKKEVSVTINQANLFGLTIFLFSSTFFSLLFYFIYNFDILMIGIKDFIFNLIITIPAIIFSILTHEFLHFLIISTIGKVKIKFIKFGFKISQGIPYIYCNKPINAFTYKLSLLAPFISLGLIPLTYSFYSGNSWFLIYSVIFITGSSADLLIFYKILRVRNKIKILDHEELPGCYILE